MATAALPSELTALPPAVRQRLERFVDVLRRWQATHNLVSARTLIEVWERHVLDSLQLADHAPEARRWVDLGSGAGFPGLVVAIARTGKPKLHVTLVEANAKKCAFLRAAAREANVSVVVACERIEAHAVTSKAPFDVVSARALAPFETLCAYAAPYMDSRSVLLLLKGRDFEAEERVAARTWDYDLTLSPSRSDSEGRVVAVRNLRRKEGRP
jgi:16S rRNA (guanine527-N7)-methyltransferase